MILIVTSVSRYRVANSSPDCDGVGRDAVVAVKDKESSIKGTSSWHCFIIVLWLGNTFGRPTLRASCPSHGPGNAIKIHELWSDIVSIWRQVTLLHNSFLKPVVIYRRRFFLFIFIMHWSKASLDLLMLPTDFSLLQSFTLSKGERFTCSWFNTSQTHEKIYFDDIMGRPYVHHLLAITCNPKVNILLFFTNFHIEVKKLSWTLVLTFKLINRTP